MPGLLGDGWDDPRSAAMTALSVGLLQGNLGGGLLGASNAFSEAKKQALHSKLLDAQLRNYDSEIEARKLASVKDARQQALIESFFPGMTGGSARGGPAPQNAPGAGAYQMGPDGMGPALPRPAQAAPQGGGGNDILALSEKLGIPPQAIQADLVFNGGKKISEMLEKHGSRDMQVTNGYAYNKNALGSGFMPSLSTSQNGQTSMVRIGADGMPVVSAPQGAVPTYGAYRGVDEMAKADTDVQTVTPQGQNPQMTTRGALVRNPAVNGSRIDPQVQAGRDADRTFALQSELSKVQAQLKSAISSGDQSGAARAQGDIAAISRELGGKSATVGMPLQSEEEKLRSSEGVKADSTRNVALAGQAQNSKDTLSNIQEARRLLALKPTASGVGSLVDSGVGFFGSSTKGADVASQLDTLSGWMVSSVPRMEGPQSNFDVKNYQTMAGLVGDRTKPISQRLKALDTLEALQQKYAHLNGGGNTINTGGASGGWEPSGKQSTMSNGGWSATLKK